MKILLNIAVAILVLLATLSGFTKVTLMPQDVEFYGQLGFSNSMLIAFGVLQLLGGVLMIISKSRVYGSVIVGVTFLVSAVLLLIAGNILVAAITLVFIVLLGFVIKHSVKGFS